MATFEYKALDQSGRKKKGVIEGDSPRQARMLLRDQGLTPVSIDASVQPQNQGGSGLFGGPRLNLRDLILFTRQLATLSRSGMPLDEALSAVSEQTEQRQARRIYLGVRGKVLEGQDFASALNSFSNAFPKLYVATVSAGETSGKLDNVLIKLAEHLEEHQKIVQKIQLAMIYPVLLTLISLLVVMGLLTYVVPQIVQVFDNLGQNLPLMTKILLQSSDFFRENGLLLLTALLVLWLLFRLLLQVDGYRLGYHRFLLSAPFIRRFSRGGNSARFTRTLAILTNSGVELLTALRIAGEVMPNLAMTNAVKDAAVRVREGMALSHALKQSKLFPPLTIHLIASGESSGQLDTMLESAAENQEREMQSLAEMVVAIFEPLLIVFMGGVVLAIVIAILLPIFEMNQLAG
ncbi:MAG: type II secretion system inner membrane protein GspF [Sedimenticola sp.]